MYAKLVFPAGTDNTLMCRDIVRCIVNSNGAGGSTVGALENVDAGSSTITDTEASGWALAAGQTIPTGANADIDKRYYIQQAHNNGSTKTVAVGMHHFDTDTGVFTKSNNTSGYNSVRMTPVLDYGEAYESVPGHPANASAASTTLAPWMGVSSVYGTSTVHIIARDKMILLAGDRKGTSGNFNFILIQEVPETYETREGRNRPGQVMHMGCRTSNSYSSTSFNNFSKMDQYTSTNPFSTSYTLPLFTLWYDALYDYESNAEVRWAGVCMRSFSDTITDPSSSIPTNQCYMFTIARDTGGTRGFSSSWNYDTTAVDLTKPTRFFFSPQGANWPYNYHYGVTACWAHTLDPKISALGLKDLNGNTKCNLIPIMFVVGNAGYTTDYTANSGWYMATNNTLTNVGIINDGTDDYLVLPVRDTTGLNGAYAIKV